MNGKNKIIIEDLKLDEGLRQFPYHCTAGKLTIGYGRNIEEKGISIDEAEMLLNHDVQECILDLVQFFQDFYDYPERVQRVLVNMRFQLGAKGFRAFKNMIAAVREQDWIGMVVQMKDSRWYTQTPKRALRLIGIIETTDNN